MRPCRNWQISAFFRLADEAGSDIIPTGLSSCRFTGRWRRLKTQAGARRQVFPCAGLIGGNGRPGTGWRTLSRCEACRRDKSSWHDDPQHALHTHRPGSRQATRAVRGRSRSDDVFSTTLALESHLSASSRLVVCCLYSHAFRPKCFENTQTGRFHSGHHWRTSPACRHQKTVPVTSRDARPVHHDSGRRRRPVTR